MRGELIVKQLERGRQLVGVLTVRPVFVMPLKLTLEEGGSRGYGHVRLPCQFIVANWCKIEAAAISILVMLGQSGDELDAAFAPFRAALKFSCFCRLGLGRLPLVRLYWGLLNHSGRRRFRD